MLIPIFYELSSFMIIRYSKKKKKRKIKKKERKEIN